MLRGSDPPRVAPHAIESFLPLLDESFRWSLKARRECGFLAYLESDGKSLQAEDISYGREVDIAWHWSRPDAAVGLSLHSHPTDDSACMPSGLDLLGALVRGDHLHYVLTLDGRITGWRFRGSRAHARAVHDALKALSDAGNLRRPFLDFLQRSFSAVAESLVEPVYGARIALKGDKLQVERCDPHALLVAERWGRMAHLK